MKHALIAVAALLVSLSASAQTDVGSNWTAAQKAKAFDNAIASMKDDANDPASLTVSKKDVIYGPWPKLSENGEREFDPAYRSAMFKVRAKNGFGAMRVTIMACQFEAKTQKVIFCNSVER